MKEPVIASLMKLWDMGAGRIRLTRVEAKNWVTELTFTEAASPETAGDNSPWESGPLSWTYLPSLFPLLVKYLFKSPTRFLLSCVFS